MIAEEHLALLDEDAITKELCSRKYRYFIEDAWKYVEPSQPFKGNWHIDAIADHCEAVARGDLQRLLISVPPGSTKSLSVSVMFPAWVWTLWPGKRFIYGSYNIDLARRDATRNRRLIDCDWYQRLWGRVFTPHWADNWEAGRFSNDQGGSRKTTSISGGVTGEHADIQVADDPHKPFDLVGSLAVSEKAKEEVWEWWSSTMASRTTDIATSSRIVVMQRLAYDDLVGRLLETGLYEYLMLPMEFEPKRKCFTSIDFEDPRSEEGELLDIKRFPKKAVDRLTKEVGPRAAKAQLQQDPSPKEGTLFKVRHFLNRFSKEEIPMEFDGTFIQSWDCTFGNSGDSYVCGQVWANAFSKYFLIDQIRERLTFTQTLRAMKKFIKKYPYAFEKLIEAKANGEAAIDSLEEEGIEGLIRINPKDSKLARANAAEPVFEMGKVWYPYDVDAPWIIEYEKEMLKFTGDKSEVNDQVDATTQAINYFRKHNSEKVKKALNAFGRIAGDI